jgi:hypothetical protein
MTARQQIARLLPLGLLVVLVIAGLRGAVPAPGWNGPLRAYGILIGIALEVLCCAGLIAVYVRETAARRAATRTSSRRRRCGSPSSTCSACACSRSASS